MPHNLGPLISALRRRYGTPANAMRALGLDEALIRDLTQEKNAMNDEPDAEVCLRAVKAMLARLPPGEAARLLEGLADLSPPDDPEMGGTEDRRRERRAADARRRLGRDETLAEAAARERREGAEDRRRFAADSAPARTSFNERFPTAARIGFA